MFRFLVRITDYDDIVTEIIAYAIDSISFIDNEDVEYDDPDLSLLILQTDEDGHAIEFYRYTIKKLEIEWIDE